MAVKLNQSFSIAKAVTKQARAHAARRPAVQAIYEGAKNTAQRRKHGGFKGNNALVQASAPALRDEARYLERNHDLCRGALRVLVNNTVGAQGIGIEPQPKIDGTNEIHQEYAEELLWYWKNWCKKPEVTQRYTFAKLQRMAANSMFRDGEMFGQMISGPATGLVHGTSVPFSLEAFESQFVPHDYDVPTRNIRQGIGMNAWGRPQRLYVHKHDPQDHHRFITHDDLKPIDWSNVLQLALMERFGQIRGVSAFASVMTRIEDLKDYEESERVAAKIAASLTAYIKKGNGDNYPSSATDLNEFGERQGEIYFSPGMVIDDLLPGEDIGLIDSNRPNPNVVMWRSGQLKAFAAGLGGSYSSISRNYDGNYSAQRQEMIEQWVNYAVLSDEFVGMFVQPVWERFVLTAELSGVVKRPPNVKPMTQDDALFIAPQMPWIDPLREASAAEKLLDNTLESEVEIIRRRGRNPNDVLMQKANFKKRAEELEVALPTGNARAARQTSEVNDG